ncbi:cytochrome P450 family protein [Phytoactinopolyspora endophytica]|uniref:cytochrome P450 family protein n=1 Tax=Phytoactinopolyspora endophytica TaxID=1642495 RepID=UPI00101C81B8|nr:cytochrome P450 [Phytoactinopolyspora endophytica]
MTPPNPFDQDYLEDPYSTLAALRRQCPVQHVELPDHSTAWVVLDHHRVHSGLADPNLSLNKKNARTGYTGLRLPPMLDANLLNMDPPDHTRLRELVSAAFTPRRVAGLRPRVQATADALVDAFPDQPTVDLVDAFTAPFPVLVICDLLGVSDQDTGMFRQWMETLLAPDPGNPTAAKDSVAAMVRFLTELIAARRERPTDDLLSALTTAREDGDQLSEEELISLVFLLFFAGFENSVHAIGNGLLALLRHDDQRAMLHADESLLPAAADEVLRYDPPLQFAIRRFALHDVELAGQAVEAGDTVLLSVAAANRDGAAFSEPDRFDISRQDVAHLTFGHGPHFCPGASLARLEIEVAFGTLLRRLPRMRLAVDESELRWRPSHRSRGLASLPVTR